MKESLSGGEEGRGGGEESGTNKNSHKNIVFPPFPPHR